MADNVADTGNYELQKLSNDTNTYTTVDVVNPYGISQASLLEVMEKGSRSGAERKMGLENLQNNMGNVAGIVSKLGSSETDGLPANEDFEKRMDYFGRNYIEPKKPKTYLELVWEGLHDLTVIMLLISAVISLVFGLTIEDNPSTGWIEGAVIMISICVVVNVAASTDYAKDIEFRRLNAEVSDETITVVRAGKREKISVKTVVVGDIVEIATGQLLPTDGLLLQGSDMKLDESSLTGEPKLIYKTGPTDPFLLAGTKVMEGNGRMIAVSVGEFTMAGQIKKKVYGGDVDTDKKDEVDGDDEVENASALFAKLDDMAWQIGKGGIIIAALSVLILFLKLVYHNATNDGWHSEDAGEVLEFIITGITILVVAIPEGLPLAVTLSLAFSLRKMQAENNLVKHLEATETMGNCTTICTDKTGTLTTNLMTARRAYIGDESFKFTDTKTIGQVVASSGFNTDYIKLLGQAISLDTTANLEPKKTAEAQAAVQSGTSMQELGANGHLQGEGNPTESALLVLANDFGVWYDDVRKNPEFSDGSTDKPYGTKQYSFSSSRKMMSWLVPLGGGKFRIFSKGAPDILLKRCVSKLNNAAQAVSFGSGEMAVVERDALTAFAKDGMRTLCIAYRDFDSEQDWEKVLPPTEEDSKTGAKAPADVYEAETKLTLLSIVGIEDPIRAEVPGAVEKCYSAGVDVRMVTGDNLQTAISIATKAGILRKEHFTDYENAVLKADFAMEGATFRSRVQPPDKSGGLDMEEFNKIWPKLRVLARSSPTDKEILVKGLKDSELYKDEATCAALLAEFGIEIYPDGQVVAVTGDGTNDAPALVKADVGFSMGITGTSIAKDACDIILRDDNFASIVTALKWGRNVYDSIQKFLQFQLTVNVAAVSIAFIGAVHLSESPLSAVQLLWVNLIMDALASLALATEPPTEDLLLRKPYGRHAPLITKRMYAFIFGHSAYQMTVILWLLYYGDIAFDIESGRGKFHGENEVFTQHYTMIFNSFVLMQLFNEFNARKLYGERNVFEGIFKNPIFVTIVVVTFFLQLLITQVAGPVFKLVTGGLDWDQWLFCIGVGAFSLPWNQVINLVYNLVVPITDEDENHPPPAEKLAPRHLDRGSSMTRIGLAGETRGDMEHLGMTARARRKTNQQISTLSLERSRS